MLGSSEVGVALAAGVVALRAGGGVVGSGTPSGQCPVYVSHHSVVGRCLDELTVVVVRLTRCRRGNAVVVFLSRSRFHCWGRGGWLRDAIRAVP